MLARSLGISLIFRCRGFSWSEGWILLARLGTESVHKSSKDAIHNAFGLVRHYIGRLGHHFRAADTLLACASRLPELFDDYAVCSISTPPKSTLPPVDAMTTLGSIIVRMLPARSPDLDRHQQALKEMDTKYNLSQRFIEAYTDANLKPRVHAELQVLEHFHAHALSFAGADPFISCSKPACFCCLLYFRHHPGHFVEPVSHYKIYLSWRPPDLKTDNDLLSLEHQRDILNFIIRDIRKEALRQIDEKSAPQASHPDSLTGITSSAVEEKGLEDLEEAREIHDTCAENNFVIEESARREGTSKAAGSALVPLALLAAAGVNEVDGAA
jgi:hypothetical protein